MLAAALVLPTASAQLVIGDEATHNRLEVTIGGDGSAHVLHEIRRSTSPVTMISVDGEYENIVMTDTVGNKENHAISRNANGFGVTIFGSNTDTIVEYDLIDAVTKVGAYETWDFYYLETTLFVLPDNADQVYINGGSANVSDSKRIKCHGCQALIEYTSAENTYEYDIELGGKTHSIGVTTAAVPRSGGFDPVTDVIRLEFDVDEHAYVGVAIPHKLLEDPYEAHYDGERLRARVVSQNDTHSDFEMRIPGTGILDISRSAELDDMNTVPPEMDVTETDNAVIAVVIAAGVIGIVVSVFAWKRKQASAQ